jgi:uncharacterized protein (UPF0303 family)
MTDFYDQLIAEEQELQFVRFSYDDAWRLGSSLRAAAVERELPVAIGIVFGGQRVFHTALPGSSADNDGWLERKTRVALRFGRASLTVGESFREVGKDFDTAARLDPALYAAHGGVVPIRIRDAGIIGVAGVSGLPQRDDHALVVEHLRLLLAAQS